MKRIASVLVLAGMFAFTNVHAQQGQTRQTPSVPLKTTFVPLTNNANAIIQEPVTPDPVRGRIAILIAHPENLNTFNYFIARELAPRGYRVMTLNYYGPETVYEEYLAPLAAAIRALHNVPGVQKVVLAGHSTGGPELTSYQDVAENGPKACQGPERVYPCKGTNLTNLPKADGVMLLDSNNGASERTIGMDPAVDSRRPRERNADLDMFNPKNGYNPATKGGTYSAEFTRKFLTAQGVRNNKVIDEALARLAKIEKGEGDYKDDEPFVVPGSTQATNGAQLRLADTRLLSRTKTPHLNLKADGTTPVEIVPSVLPSEATTEDLETLRDSTQNYTVRHYLSYLALRTTAQYATTENDVLGVQWRSTPNSVPGNLEGITVPTLVVVGTCAGHVVLDEIGYLHSAAKDKDFVAVEGANHSLEPCQPQYGNTAKRAFDYVDGWLNKSGRF